MLLERFVAHRDEEAFRSLVARHGPMVWGVCRRSLHRQQDAEDAFQATFIVLARKADRVIPREMLPGWLHGVARRAVRKVLEISDRRRELQVESMPEPVSEQDGHCPDLAAVLDEELERLPLKLKQAVVLCHLQGLTYAEAGREMGCSIAAVAARLEKAMALLRNRLGRRGLAPAAVVALFVMAGPTMAVPAGLSARTFGGSLALCTQPQSVAGTVAERVMHALGGTRSKVVGILLAAIGVGVTTLAVADTPNDQRAVATSPPVSVVNSNPPLRLDRFGDPLPEGAVSRIGTVRFRLGQFHSDGDVAFLPGGSTLVSVHSTSRLCFWDLVSGKEVGFTTGPPKCTQVAVSADGKRIVAMGLQVWAWDMTPAGPRIRWKRPLGRGHLSAVAISPNGRTVACGTANGPTAYLLDADTGETVRVIEGQGGHRVTFSPDGKKLATGVPTATVCLWDVASGELTRQFHGPRHAPVRSFDFAPDGSTLATASVDRAVRIWDLATGELRATAGDCESPDPVVLYARDGRTLLEVGGERIQSRDPATGAVIRPAVVAPHLHPLWSFSSFRGKTLSADGRLLASESSGVVGVWKVATGEEVGPAGALHGQVITLAFAPDGRTLATTARFSHVQIWEADTGAPIRRLPFREPGLTAYTLSYPSLSAVETLEWCPEPASHWVLTRWDTQTGEATERPGMPTAWAGWKPSPDSAFAASADGRRLAWGSSDGVVLTDRATGRETLIAKGTDVSYVAFSENGQSIACYGKRDKALTVWKTETGEPVMTLPVDLTRHFDHPPVALSRDGRQIAVAVKEGNDGDLIRVWGVGNEKPPLALKGPRSDTLVLAFSPDGRFLVSGDESGAVQAWNVRAGCASRRLDGHRSRVQALAFSPDGRRLASGSADSTAVVWDTGSFASNSLGTNGPLATAIGREN